MADFSIYFPLVCELEGTDYENPSDDQCNKFGLEVQDVIDFTGNTATCADVQAITSDLASTMIKQLYWDKVNADNIDSQFIGMFLADMAFNQGVETASIAIQAIVGVTTDGIIGNDTLEAINNFDEQTLFYFLWSYRLCLYIKTGKPEFEAGWRNRINNPQFNPNT